MNHRKNSVFTNHLGGKVCKTRPKDLSMEGASLILGWVLSDNEKIITGY